MDDLAYDWECPWPKKTPFLMAERGQDCRSHKVILVIYVILQEQRILAEVIGQTILGFKLVI
jgi:hypothetical protein